MFSFIKGYPFNPLVSCGPVNPNRISNAKLTRTLLVSLNVSALCNTQLGNIVRPPLVSFSRVVV
jgi:hypothetical protein